MQSIKFASALAVLCLGAGCGIADADRRNDAVVRVAGAVYQGDAPTVVAQARGLFDQAGIRVETAHLDSGKESLARLRAGKADFALSALTPIVLDRLADETPGEPDDPVIIASLVHSNDLLQIALSQGSGIRGPADFAGKRIAINRGTNTEFVWWLYEQYHGLERRSVELVDLPFSQMRAALGSARVDAAVLWEPRVSGFDPDSAEAEDAHTGHLHLDNLYAGKWVLVTSRRTASNRGDLCRRLLRAYRRAIEFTEDDPNEAIATYDRHFGLSGGIDAHHWNTLDYELTLDWSLIAGLQEQFHWAAAAGYENTGEAVHILELIEPEPLRQQWPGTVGIPGAGRTEGPR